MIVASFFEKYATLIIFPMLAAFVSLILTYLAIQILPKLGYIDKPGGRHIHQRIVPRGGGIAVIIAFFAVLALYIFGQPNTAAASSSLFWRLLWPALLLGGLGIIDDRIELKSWHKLLVQFIVVLIIWWEADNPVILGWTLPGYMTLFFLLIWVIIIINAFNLIDGLDGLASGLAIVSSGCMAIWFLLAGGHYPEAVCMLILAGSCLGFLRYNFYPARIFLGDTGSTFLGLIFAIIGLSTIDRAVTVTSLLLPLLAIGVPLFDVVLAIWRRSTRKLLNPEAGGIMDGDQDHLHHRLLRQTKKQPVTACIMYLIGCAFSGIVLIIITLQDYAPAVAYVILLIAVLIMIRQLAQVELYDSAILIQRGLAKPRKGSLINTIHPMIDFVMIGISYMAVSWLMIGNIYHFPLFLSAFAPTALILCFSGVYRVYWLRPGLNNYWNLALIVFVGSILSCLFVYFFQYPYLISTYNISGKQLFSSALLFLLLNLTLISLERFLVHYAEGFWFRKIYMTHHNSAAFTRCIIYGGGLKCRTYINYISSASSKEDTETVIGIMDDDFLLHGKLVYGVPVFGSSTQIEQIYRDHPFDKVIVSTSSVPEEDLEKLRIFCKSKNIQLFRISFLESDIINTDSAVPAEHI